MEGVREKDFLNGSRMSVSLVASLWMRRNYDEMDMGCFGVVVAVCGFGQSYVVGVIPPCVRNGRRG